jgi:hypothetical protein
MLDESYVATEACRVYAATQGEETFKALFGFIRAHLDDRR